MAMKIAKKEVTKRAANKNSGLPRKLSIPLSLLCLVPLTFKQVMSKDQDGMQGKRGSCR